MSYAIVGFGKIGQALAHAFARKNIDVAVASRRPPEALAPHLLVLFGSRAKIQFELANRGIDDFKR
jgi:predicted dinucleotide-binding enzyme